MNFRNWAILILKKSIRDIVPNIDNGTVDITWGLEEKSSDQLELSAGFGGGIGLTGTLGVTFNNFSIYNIFNKKAWQPLPSGDGQKLSFGHRATESNSALIIFHLLSHGLVVKKEIHLQLVITTRSMRMPIIPIQDIMTALMLILHI